MTDKLGVLFTQLYTGVTIAQRKNLMESLEGLLSRKETYWRQQSQVTWLREKDRN